MTRLHFTIILLGLSLFLWDISYGVGWLLGWLFIGILRHYREAILNYVIDLNNFKVSLYILYLIGIVVWLAIPLGLSLLVPNYINAMTVFGAYFIDRILLFVTQAVKRGE